MSKNSYDHTYALWCVVDGKRIQLTTRSTKRAAIEHQARIEKDHPNVEVCITDRRTGLCV